MDSTRLISEVKPDDLRAGDWIRVVWGLFWRGLIFSVASMLVGGITGGIIGFCVGILATILDWSTTTYMLPLQIASGFVGLAIGMLLMIFYIRWLLLARFRWFRLAFVRTTGTPPSER